MVCPRCGMQVPDGSSVCKSCGAPIPQELGGERPDPIFDDDYDWLRAEELKEAAESRSKKPRTAPRREERQRLAKEKAEEKSSLTTKVLIGMIVAVALVLVLLSVMFFRLTREVGEEIQFSPPAASASPLPVRGTPEPTEAPTATPAPTAEPTPTPLPTPEPTTAPTPVPADADYLLPDSSSRTVTDADLAGLTHEQCCLARNEIYARHGRIFATAAISRYFTGKSWYNGSVSGENFSDSVLNSVEIENIRLISEYEDRVWGGSYY